MQEPSPHGPAKINKKFILVFELLNTVILITVYNEIRTQSCSVELIQREGRLYSYALDWNFIP